MLLAAKQALARGSRGVASASLLVAGVLSLGVGKLEEHGACWDMSRGGRGVRRDESTVREAGRERRRLGHTNIVIYTTSNSPGKFQIISLWSIEYND